LHPVKHGKDSKTLPEGTTKYLTCKPLWLLIGERQLHLFLRVPVNRVSVKRRLNW
jgi:hypothetical protein